MRPIDGDDLLNHKRMMTEDMGDYMVSYSAIPTHYVDDMPTLSLNTLRDAIYEDAVAHGLWEEADRYAEKYAQMCANGIEQEMRDHMLNCCASGLVLGEAEELYDSAETDNFDGFEEELADIIIMSLSVAGKLGIDIDAAVRRKMEINKARPWKHGRDASE